TTNGTTARAFETSKITTSTESDFWAELKMSLLSIIGEKEGRTVVVSPQSGVVLVRALPLEIRQVERYLKATQLSVDRQVMLEAKIIEVQLNDGYQSGINWGAFNKSGQNRFSVGADANSLNYPYGDAVAGSTLSNVLGGTLPKVAGAAGGLLNIAVQADNFAALISFLNTQGTVHVLSSPRIATMNNQMAVLKVGTDDFFVTNVSSTTVTGTTTTSTPNVTLRPFFSGIALDVMPQISDDGQITLHVHPSVSQVSEKDKTVDLGGNLGKLHLPLASSTVSETDSVVRVQDGSIVAIGGLMQQSMSDDRAGVPVAGDVPVVGALFRQTNRASQKRELVILLKTTVVHGNGDWADDVLQSRDRIRRLQGDDAESDPGVAPARATRP
ncbi:MAG: pilus (MSHA type) biogenesis protein MshL, partial [Pseudomonadota bacterium]|nr:pilus (MSHA type) biogenesis protein MshL [Pseudomonadota bacterium]